jgi:hypothetical protein
MANTGNKKNTKKTTSTKQVKKPIPKEPPKTYIWK